MTYNVMLDVFQGVEYRPRFRTSYRVSESGPLSAMARAEQHVNVMLPDEQYAIARYARPRFWPRPAIRMPVPIPMPAAA